MALLDHFTRNAGTEPGQNGFPRYSGHQFEGDMKLVLIESVGDPGDGIVRNKIVNDFNKPDGLTVDDQIQLDEMIAFYATLNVGQQNLYLHKVGACISLLEQELMTKSKASSILGITNA